MRSVAAAVAALACALGIAACGPGDDDGLPEQEFESAVPEGFFGVNGQGLRPLAEQGELELLDRHLETIANGGIEFVRVNVNWPAIEPSAPSGGRHSYDLSTLDVFVNALAEHGLALEPAVMGIPTPTWAADPEAAPVCGSRSPPARASDAAALAGALARRYGSEGTFWRQNPELEFVPVLRYELWNEPNLVSFWCPAPDPRAYAALADASANTILAADPNAKLVLGGLAAVRETVIEGPHRAQVASAEFLPRMLAARPALARKLDSIGVHAYGGTPEAVLERLAYQRRAADAAGLGELPLSFNETGWYTAGLGPTRPVGEQQRAAYIAELTSAAARSNCGLDSFAVHTWVSGEQRVTNIEDWYGIADPLAEDERPSAEAYLNQVLTFEGRSDVAPPSEPVDVC